MLGNLSASDSHCESDIGLLKGRGIVGTVSSDSDDFAELTKSSHKKVFVLRARAGKDSEIGLNCLEGLHVANSLFAVFPLDEAAHALVELGALHDESGLESSSSFRMLHSRAMALAVIRLSPVTMRTVIPALWQRATALGTSSLITSLIPAMAIKV